MGIEIEKLLEHDSLTIAKSLKAHIEAYFTTIEDTFAKTGGKDFLVQHTRFLDTIIQAAYRVVIRDTFQDYLPMRHSIPIALVALGSYGREQLCIYSDIDLMIVYEDIGGYNAKQIIEKILYLLWDTGLKLGHRVHPLDELQSVATSDNTIKTAIIESRFIEGSKTLWFKIQNKLHQIRHDNRKLFIHEKLLEQAKRYTNYPLTMEPNLKEGAGGFRDANLVFWIGKVYFDIGSIRQLPSTIIEDDEYKSFRTALEFIFRVRTALHIITKKKEDTLRLELVPEVAALLGYEPSKKGHMIFGKQVIESLQTIRLYTGIWRDNLVSTPTNGQKLHWHTALKILCDPTSKDTVSTKILLGAKRPLKHSKATLQTIKKIFFLPDAHRVLQTISDARLLGYLIAPLKVSINLPQFDGYHLYPVDVHSLKTLYYIEHIQEEYIQKLFSKLTSEQQALLKLTALLHDAGKGRNKDHHLVGANLIKQFAKKLQFQDELIESAERLILYHTLMSRVAQREDLHDERTILGFASHFPTKTLMSMITILTYADMSAVNHGVYNSFNAKLIQTLYNESLQKLDQKELLSEAAKRVKKEAQLTKHPTFVSLPKHDQKKILLIPSDLPFLRYSADEIMSLFKRCDGVDDYTFWITNEPHLTLEIIRKTPLNLGYLLGRLSHLEVMQMEICKLFDGLKYFKIIYKEPTTLEDTLFIEEIINDSFKPNKTLCISHPQIYKKEILINCDYSQSYASMKLNTRNQKGLLAYIAQVFDNLGIDIASAKIHTVKNRTQDTFLIEKNGNFCHNTKLVIQKLTENN